MVSSRGHRGDGDAFPLIRREVVAILQIARVNSLDQTATPTTEAHYISAAVNYGRIVVRPSTGRARAAEFVTAFAPRGVGSASRQLAVLDGR